MSPTRHSLAAKPFVADAAVAKPPIGSGLVGGSIAAGDEVCKQSLENDFIIIMIRLPEILLIFATKKNA